MPNTWLWFFGHLVLYAAVWLVLTEGQIDSWTIGVPTIIAAAAVAVALRPARRWRLSLIGLARFVPFFIGSSLWAGIDVAWRSLHPRLLIAPGIVEFQLRLPNGTSRVFFMNIVNLLPGTVSVDLRGDVLLVHVIDNRRPIVEQLNRLEQVIAGLFCIPLSDSQPNSLPNP
jgi:multicomponent Na+:H+ antiporter subunit E